jgi:hypothetical protein
MSREPGAGSREPGAESRKPKAESRKPKANRHREAVPLRAALITAPQVNPRSKTDRKNTLPCKNWG